LGKYNHFETAPETMGYHGGVRVLLLTARPDLKTNRRLAEAAESLGLEVSVLDTSTVSAVAANDGVRAVGDSALDPLPDTVIARVGNWRPESSLAVLEALTACGVSTPNSPTALRLGRDHWSTIRILTASGLRVPETIAGADPEALAGTATELLEYPVVVKQRRSRMGVGVIRCRSRDHLEAVLDSLWRVGDEVVVQRWLPEGVATIRALVVSGSVVAAARHSAGDGEWRSNAARGGDVTAHRPSTDESSAAVAAAAALGLGHCGVDLVPTSRGPVVLEVNPTPGFLGLERATGIDVARAIVHGAITPREP
jgi:RimK family alpha-L-glutamate ligase